MSDGEEKETPMAECGSCRAIIPLDSKECSECGIKISGVSEASLGECGACNSLVPIDSKMCPDCGVYFVADDVLDVLRNWFNNTGIEAQKLFEKFDSDSDGSIDADELRNGLLKMNLADLPPSQVDRLIKEVDTDSDGVISLEELVFSITGEEIPSSEPVSEEVLESSKTAKDYSENVLDRIVEKHAIENKSEFLEFAQSYDANNNDYLTESELKKAAIDYVEQISQSNSESEEVVEQETGTEKLTEEDDSTNESITDADEDEEEMVEQESSESEEIIEELIADSALENLNKLVSTAAGLDMTIRSMFESIDGDEDGMITGPELQKGIVEICGDSLSPSEVFEIISLIDEDSNGRIDAFELIDMIESMDIDMDSDLVEESASGFQLLTNYMDEAGYTPSALFNSLDIDGDNRVSKEELSLTLHKELDDDITPELVDELMDMFDEDDDGFVDMIEFVGTIEEHDDEEVDQAASLSDKKEFPTKWQRRMMSKKWKDVVWPLVHSAFVFFIILWVVNATLAPFVDGTGGIVEMDSEFGATTTADGTTYFDGDAYPCDESIQIEGCKNSLAPLAAAGGEISMPAGFYWDGILFIILGTMGLMGSLFLQLSVVPGWRARARAMKENSSDRSEVKTAIADENESKEEEEVEDGKDDEAIDSVEETDILDDEKSEEEEEEEDDIDIGSYIGLVLEDEEVFGTIIEFDDEEGLVTIEEDGTGDLVTGYQDDMFLDD
ncbi:MAG: EF-hand domain-containing protein [Candidatus Poseidoniaceae archaeon]|nr:EF-hand domain-containing protein [Candidatus Poseidoniaceae archaeon]MBL6895783.1 EF-hand domain-containing protein [Candidatus Poseidoniaceae archaeon]